MTDPAPGPAPQPQPARVPAWRVAVLVLLVALTAGASIYGNRNLKPSGQGVIMDLPYQLGDYWGIETEVTPAERLILPGDTEFARKVYSSIEDENILCSIVLSGAEKRSIHRPEVCLPAQGWTIANKEVVPVKLSNGHILRVTLLTLNQPVRGPDGLPHIISSLFAYWFVGENRLTHSHWERVFVTSWDRVFDDINHRWAYVIVSMPVTATMRPGGRDKAQTLEEIKKFISIAAPVFLKPQVFARDTTPGTAAAN